MARQGGRARVVIGGELLEPGRHALRLVMPAGEGTRERQVTLGVVVGERPGPRGFVVAGSAGHDGNALAAARELVDAVEPSLLRGSLLTVGLADEDEGAATSAADSPRARAARWVLALLAGKPAFGVELRSAPVGLSSWPHVRVDLAADGMAALARAMGAEVVVEAAALVAPGAPVARVRDPFDDGVRRVASAAGVPTLIVEGGELGRWDGVVVAHAVTLLRNLLRARKMLPGAPERPPWHAVVKRCEWGYAPATGWLEPITPPGAVVARGDLLVRVRDGGGGVAGEVRSPGRGLVLAAPVGGRIEEGAAVTLLGRLGPKASASARAAGPATARTHIGFCEWIALPELGIERLHAKIDTGARTCALHVRSLKQVGEQGGRHVLEVRLPTGRRPHGGRGKLCRVVVEEYVTVRDSGGHEERRPVIATTLSIGPISRRVRVSLTDRGDMLFPMLIGRTALGEDFLIDAAARNLLGERV